MKLISSDTNVWIDFKTIERLELPFKLPYVYLMNNDAVENECLEPKGLSESLLNLGLMTTELSEEEFYFVDELNQKYKKLSTFDCIALGIAKCRKITLLTGDGALRKAAQKENVEVIGSLKILDTLYEMSLIDQTEYLFCLLSFKKLNGGKIRLPEQAIQERIERINKENRLSSGF